MSSTSDRLLAIREQASDFFRRYSRMRQTNRLDEPGIGIDESEFDSWRYGVEAYLSELRLPRELLDEWAKTQDISTYLYPNVRREQHPLEPYEARLRSCMAFIRETEPIVRLLDRGQFTSQGTGNAPEFSYVDPARLIELRAVSSPQFDLAKLIQLCEELNKCYSVECYFAIAMLTRAILDHVPPIFECSTFSQLANNYSGSRAFKKSMQHLENSLRNIADAHLHIQIRSKEVIPNKTQV